MTDPSELAEHLRFFAELGADGVSRDAAWRRRAEDAAEPDNATENGIGANFAGSDEPKYLPTPISEAGSDEPKFVPIPFSAPLDPAAPSPRGDAPAQVYTDPAAALDALRLTIGHCTRCKLHALGRSKVVFGVGNPGAQLMFVGEGPGADEDAQGEPFVGRAGQLLTRMIEAIDLKREQVYIANVVKCRPPQNRNPEPDEIATCEPFLFEQIAIIRPKVIVALGKFAAQTLLRSTAPISKLRGQVFSYHGALLVPTFHPAFLLRSPDYKREAWEDLKKVRALLAEP